MAAADPAMPMDESKQTSITETSQSDSKPIEEEKEKKEEKEEKELVSTKDDQNVGKEVGDKAGDDDDDVEYPHGVKLAVILAALCLAIFLVALDQTIIVTAIPKITDQFNSVGVGKTKYPIGACFRSSALETRSLRSDPDKLQTKQLLTPLLRRSRILAGMEAATSSLRQPCNRHSEGYTPSSV
jgi:hypothetical protein